MRTGVLLAALGCGAMLIGPVAASATAPPPIKHVFVIVEENKSEATTFGHSSQAPYLSQTLVSQGAFAPNYYGIGHASNDNYIAMVSGQAPNPMTSADCGTFSDFASPTSIDPSGQETGQGCVYPADVATLMSQLSAKGLTWRAYEDGMGADPAREAASCGHPPLNFTDNTEVATPIDQYATRHDPFVYFHSVIDNAALCNANVVNLNRLPDDLRSAATTPNYTFITPNLCNDGHDAVCANGGPGGLAQADAVLRVLVPLITGSPAFKQNGLLIITFDEAVGDSTACCGERPGPYDAAYGIQPGGSGPGGGAVGAVLLSPFIKAGTMSRTAYNHYSMLGSVEDLFGLPRLAYATGTTAFGSDLFDNPPNLSRLRLKPSAWSFKHPGTTISYTDSVAVRTTLVLARLASGYRIGHRACKLLQPGHKRPKHSRSCTFAEAVGRLTHADAAGTNSFHFGGRLYGRKLAVGPYSLTATPSAGSLVGNSVTVKLRVTRR